MRETTVLGALPDARLHCGAIRQEQPPQVAPPLVRSAPVSHSEKSRERSNYYNRPIGIHLHKHLRRIGLHAFQKVQGADIFVVVFGAVTRW